MQELRNAGSETGSITRLTAVYRRLRLTSCENNRKSAACFHSCSRAPVYLQTPLIPARTGRRVRQAEHAVLSLLPRTAGVCQHYSNAAARLKHVKSSELDCYLQKVTWLLLGGKNIFRVTALTAAAREDQRLVGGSIPGYSTLHLNVTPRPRPL